MHSDPGPGTARRGAFRLAFIALILVSMILLSSCEEDDDPGCAGQLEVVVDQPSQEAAWSTADSTLVLVGSVQLAGDGSFFPTYVFIENLANGSSRAADVRTTGGPCLLTWRSIGSLALGEGANPITVSAAVPDGVASVAIVVTRVAP